MPKPKLQKLDPRSREAIFLGYLSDSKGYKLWDINNQKCLSSRDVKFLEVDQPEGSDDSNAENSSISIPIKHYDKDEEVLNRGGEEASRVEDSPTETHKT